MIRLDGPLLARAWLSVAAAASSDKEDPQLFKAVAIEEHPTGVRLIATDRHILLTSWIPDLEHLFGNGSKEPDFATLPDRTVIAADIHGRASSMLRHILTVAAQIEKSDYTLGDVEVSIDFDGRVPIAGPAGFDGMDPRHVVLKSPDVESVYVPIVEMAFADWRRNVDAHRLKATEEITYSADLIQRLAGVRKYAGGEMHLRLGGHTPTMVDYPKSDPAVFGLVLPTRDRVDEVNP